MAVLKSTINGTTWAKVNGKAGPVGAVGLPGPAGYGRNRLINGDFSVNQRALTSVVNSGYVHDRWLLTPYDGTVTYSTVATTAGELSEAAISYARINTTGQTLPDSYTQWVQRVESARSLAGKQVTLSFWAKGSSSFLKVGFHFTQSFGSGGSAAVRTALPMVTIGTTWARYTMTGTIPSVAGMTIGANDYLNCVFWTSAGANQTIPGPIGIQNSIIDFWGIQLEEGSFATPFEKKSYGEELRGCQRYFQRWQQPPLRGLMTNPSWGARFGMPLPVTMRVAPTAAMNGQFAIYDGAGTGVATSIAGSFLQPMLVEFDLQCNTFSAAGRTGILYQSGASYLDLSAEL